MLKINNFFAAKIKLPIELYQIEIMNNILTSLSKNKNFRKSGFAILFENRLVKKRENVNNILKAIILKKADISKNENNCVPNPGIVELNQYAKGA